jgi:hypothetical protein|nr:MAG TPA: hypothetical protein [Caudoviricetes sp.]
MYHFKEFAKKVNLVDQLPGCDVIVRCDRILIDAPDFRLDVYGWPDNRVVFANKMTGVNTIKRYGHTGGEKCREIYYEMLESIGVDLTAIE